MLTIIGAGIAGVSLAYHLAVRHGMRDIVLIDSRPPLSLTSDKSTECYRNWWPGPDNAMIALMNRSITLLEELAQATGNRFHLNRRGYLFLTARQERLAQWQSAAEMAARMGAGPVRIHEGKATAYRPAALEGWQNQPTGVDLLVGRQALQTHFPYVGAEAIAGLHVCRAGWLSAQQLGMTLLTAARAVGVQVWRGRVVRLAHSQNKVQALYLEDGTHLPVERLVLAPGPFLKPLAAQLGIDLPVVAERHLKLAFSDRLQALPRTAPLLIWDDPQRLDWTPEERLLLDEMETERPLGGLLPPGAHTRPEGGAASQMAVALWEYDTPEMSPRFPVPQDDLYPEVVLRGLERMLPAMRAYRGHLPRPVVDGGYYVKTPENRPLIGPLPVEGAFVLGALSGFGIMASQGAADLLAAYLTETPLPPYAAAFHPQRYQDPAYRRKAWQTAWQL